jgi:glycosyltransferase involved in cell wall biosynthesis
MTHFSVIMSVYNKENPDYLQQSLDSIFNQTLPPSEVVLVHDGPLDDQLQEVIGRNQTVHAELKTVKLPECMGLGGALNEGLRHCSYDLVARMDTDDIAKPERFQTQIAWMEQHPDTAVCGSWIDEFIGDTSHVISSRKPPRDHQSIVNFARKRNPMNHPTVIFRRQAVEEVGGYQHFYLFEDYYLWTRMIMAGCKFHNIQQSLLYFRMSDDMFQRRGGLKYSQSEIRLQRQLRQMGFIGWGTMIQNMAYRIVVRHMPNKIRRFVYITLLRR